MSQPPDFNPITDFQCFNLPPPNVPPPFTAPVQGYQEPYYGPGFYDPNNSNVPHQFPAPAVDIFRPPPLDLNNYNDNQFVDFENASYSRSSENRCTPDLYRQFPVDVSRPPPPPPPTASDEKARFPSYGSESRDSRSLRSQRRSPPKKSGDSRHHSYSHSSYERDRRDRESGRDVKKDHRSSREAISSRRTCTESRYPRPPRESNYRSQSQRLDSGRRSNSRDRHSYSRQTLRESSRRSRSRSPERDRRRDRDRERERKGSQAPRSRPEDHSRSLSRRCESRAPTEARRHERSGTNKPEANKNKTHSSRHDYCSTMDEVYDKMDKNVNGVSDEEGVMNPTETKRWYRSSPADLYYTPVPSKKGVMESTAKGIKLAEQVKEKLIERGRRARPAPEDEPLLPPRCHKPRLCKMKYQQDSSSGSSASSESECDEADRAMQELERKQQHPRRLHPHMWYNDSGEMNDGPFCRCSARTRRQGIRHGIYALESRSPPCNLDTNNADKLYHYRITISPPTNFLIKTLTVITHDEHEFLFSGFSLLSHYPLTKLPPCKVIRFNIEYTILYEEEQSPLNYTINELELFEEFLFTEILELVDLDMGKRDILGCSQFHLLPRWERGLGDGGGEVLAMSEVLRHLLRAGGVLLPPATLPALHAANEREWQTFVDGVRGQSRREQE